MKAVSPTLSTVKSCVSSLIVGFVLLHSVLCLPDGLRQLGNSSSWVTRTHQLSRRFVLEDLQPIPAHGTCRLSWYTPAPPAFGNQVLCSGSKETCLQPCNTGFELLPGSNICLQRCPDPSSGPAHLCPVSRTCIRGDSVCPMLADVPYSCAATGQFLGSCAKQSYQAVVASKDVNLNCDDGLILQDHTGGWRCVSMPDYSPCSLGFSSSEEMQGGIGTRCKQVCPTWLVDCGDTCNMLGVPCSARTNHLCPVVPLTACDMSERSATALQTACQLVGLPAADCPLTLNMHGSCGAKLQVTVGLSNHAFVSKIEAWWNPGPAGPARQSSADGPLKALRISFSAEQEPVVLGNISHTYAQSPRTVFRLDPSDLVVSSRLWSSAAVMEGSQLTPVLAGFDIFTSSKQLWVLGNEASRRYKDTAAVSAAEQQWQRQTELSGSMLGVGLPVGAAAYTSEGGVYSFGLIFLTKVAKQEL